MRILLVLLLLGSTVACTIDKRPRQPKPCTVSENALGAVINCVGQSPVQVNHGINGLVETVLLCEGSNEYALRIGNELYAVYHGEITEGKDKGKSYTYLALLSEGNYTTTDGTNCVFSVGPNGTLN